MRIITNEKYAGLIRNHFGEYEGNFEPIIEKVYSVKLKQ